MARGILIDTAARECHGVRQVLLAAILRLLEFLRVSPERILLAKSFRLFVGAAASPQPSPRSGEGWGEAEAGTLAVALWIRQQ